MYVWLRQHVGNLVFLMQLLTWCYWIHALPKHFGVDELPTTWRTLLLCAGLRSVKKKEDQ
jgi:hypothetical protein